MIGGKSSDETTVRSPESPKEVDRENTRMEPDSQTGTTIQENIMQPGVQEDVSSSSGAADPLPALQLVFESTTLRVEDQQIREQISTSHDIQPELTDSVAPETPQDLTVSLPDSPLGNQVDDTYLQSHFQVPETILREVLRRIALSPTSPSQSMYERQIAALLSSPLADIDEQDDMRDLLVTPLEEGGVEGDRGFAAMADIDEQFNDVEDEARLMEDDMMDLLVTRLEEGGVEGDRGFAALVDPNDTDTGTHISMSEFIMFPESDTVEEGPSLPVPRVERFEPPPVLQRCSVGTQCDTPPKQYVEVNVQTDDTAPPPSPDFCRAACNEVEVMRPFLRRVMQKAEWKAELNQILTEVRFDLWRKGWAKDREDTAE